MKKLIKTINSTTIMKKSISLVALILALGFSSMAQFEGKINFDKVKSETTKYVYYIKGENVRIDEFGSDGAIKGIMLVNTTKGTATSMLPDRKLYMDASNSKTAAPVNPTVNKTSNTKTIQGYKCTEWIVKSEKDGTEISYWVIDKKDFPFFKKLLTTLNRKDRLSKYWLEVPGIDNLFTMVGEERALDGSVRTRLEVTSVEPQTLESSLFEIPQGYVKFER